MSIWDRLKAVLYKLQEIGRGTDEQIEAERERMIISRALSTGLQVSSYVPGSYTHEEVPEDPYNRRYCTGVNVYGNAIFGIEHEGTFVVHSIPEDKN